MRFRDEDYSAALLRDFALPFHFLIAVLFFTTVVLVGLGILFFDPEISVPAEKWATFGGTDLPRKGSRSIVGMAFFGAYLWGLRYLFRRYTMDDLIPGVFYTLRIRMILAPAIAVLLFHALGALTGAGGNGGSAGITELMWPVVAFLVGIFPQRRAFPAPGRRIPWAMACPCETVDFGENVRAICRDRGPAPRPRARPLWPGQSETAPYSGLLRLGARSWAPGR